MNRNNKGYEIEFEMKRWFKGDCHHNDCVDFQTKTSLYEVKACNMFNHCVNGNHKRVYSGDKPHKKITTTQLGRFFIKNYNHNLLSITAKLERKIPKYIFVVTVGKQKIWKVVSWNDVNKLISGSSEQTAVRIKDIFTEGL